MTELSDEEYIDDELIDPMEVVPVGLDDGYAYTKMALPERP